MVIFSQKKKLRCCVRTLLMLNISIVAINWFRIADSIEIN